MNETEVTTATDILSGTPEDVMERLKEKSIEIPSWSDELEKEYDPLQHPVMDKSKYPDITEEDGSIQYVTRITQDLQRLAAKRTTELVFGLPVKRVYKSETDKGKEIGQYIDSILERNRINSLNIERGNLLFAGCEFATIWYATEEPNSLYGFDSKLKLRCKNYSPMWGDEIYPYFDETGDMKALSFGYKRKSGDTEIEYFDIYTADCRLRLKNDGAGWIEEFRAAHTLGKIPGIYCYRPAPAWEDTSEIVYEIEWALSRNGNYLRKNSKPYLALFTDETVETGSEPDEKTEFRGIVHLPKGADLKYVVYPQAIENLKFHVTELRQAFFTQLQIPDWSYDNMKTMQLSGEAFKQLFVDAHLKVTDESGRIIEALDREINIIKAYLKTMLPPADHAEIDNLEVETEITPFTITDDKDTINTIMTATGGKSILSRREGIERLNWSKNVNQTLEEIQQEETVNLFEPTL